MVLESPNEHLYLQSFVQFSLFFNIISSEVRYNKANTYSLTLKEVAIKTDGNNAISNIKDRNIHSYIAITLSSQILYF